MWCHTSISADIWVILGQKHENEWFCRNSTCPFIREKKFQTQSESQWSQRSPYPRYYIHRQQSYETSNNSSLFLHSDNPHHQEKTWWMIQFTSRRCHALLVLKNVVIYPTETKASHRIFGVQIPKLLGKFFKQKQIYTYNEGIYTTVLCTFHLCKWHICARTHTHKYTHIYIYTYYLSIYIYTCM